MSRDKYSINCLKRNHCTASFSIFLAHHTPKKMACVTLKRPVDVLGSPHLMESEPTVKRRRCGMSLFPTTPPGPSSERFSSDHPQCGRSSPGLTRHHVACTSPMSVKGVKRAKRKLDIDHYSVPPSSPPMSPFLSATPPIETGDWWHFLMV